MEEALRVEYVWIKNKSYKNPYLIATKNIGNLCKMTLVMNLSTFNL